MFKRILSNDLPKSSPLALLLILIVLSLALGPFWFTGAKALNVCVKIMIFIVLVASFDLLLGYTGIVSFAHVLFFGLGSYGVGIALSRYGTTWTSLAVGLAAAFLFSGLLALAVGLFSLRVRAIFFSMITLAFSAAAQTLTIQMSHLTGGEDGIIYKLPPALMPGNTLFELPLIDFKVTGRIACYYLIFAVSLLCFLALLRIVNSSFGRILLAIRDNEFRAEAIGYRTVVFRTLATVIASTFACVAGALLALWLRYTGPDSSLSFEIMLDVLIIVIVGGVGTMYGAIVGSALFLVAQGYLQELLKVVGEALSFSPTLANLFSSDRWLLWLGVLFVFAVYFFPSGLVGLLRKFATNRRASAS